MNVSTSDWLEQVVWEARAGGENALRLLHHKYAPRLYGYLFYMLDDAEREAEQAIRAILRETVQGSESLIRGASFGTRAHRAAYLRLTCQPARAAVGPCEQRSVGRDQPALLPAQAPFALDCHTFRAALRHLSEDERQVVVLRLVQRFSAADTAWVMDRPEEDVTRLQARALVKLKVVLQSWGSNGRN